MAPTYQHPPTLRTYVSSAVRSACSCRRPNGVPAELLQVPKVPSARTPPRSSSNILNGDARDSERRSPRERDADFIDPGKCDILSLDEDVYGAMEYSIIFDFFEILTGKDHDNLSIFVNIYRLISTTIVLVLNYALQIGLVIWVNRFISQPQSHDSQRLYRDYHNLTFRNGTFRWDLWDDWNEKNELCELVYSNFWFMFSIVGLWWMVMLLEFRNIERTFRKMRLLPNTDDPNLMVRKSKHTEEVPHYVMSLTPATRAALYILLIFGKFVIVSSLTIIGSKWLVSSKGFEELILNSLSLDFIVRIDQILYEGIFDENTMQSMASMKLVIPEKLDADQFNIMKLHETKQKWGLIRSIFYLIGLLAAVYAFLTVGQQVPHLGTFPDYADDASCPRWWAKRNRNLCTIGVECFPINPSIPPVMNNTSIAVSMR